MGKTGRGKIMSTNKQALRKELSNPAIGSNAHLRKLALALLDELAAANVETEKSNLLVDDLRRERNFLQDLAGKRQIELEAATKRIAELEAREVVLPATFWYEHDDLPREIPVLSRRLVIKALREAGIKIAAGTTVKEGGE
jgi:hypothetical protein